LGKLLTSEEIYNNLSHMSSQADAGVGRALGEADTLSVSVRHVVDRTDSLVANVNTMFTRLNAGGGTIGALLAERTVYDSLLLAVGNTVRATEQANVGARRFAEDMEALKHNWLLKGYFEDRGYWDEADYEHALDRKLDSLKTLESTLARQVQELEQRNAMTPR
jgi:phospholipid/cholesterol/gamma-HCH transport system substrate-binding protein